MARAVFRCYAELNDFLSPGRRQRDIELEHAPEAPLRHLIETLGIPRTEVELILVNGVSVGLDRRLAEGDRVSLYPLFEALDVSPELRLRTHPLRDPRFLADAHLGKLARYLRLLGFDARFENDCGDQTLVQVARAEHRILLTRDRALLMRRELTHGCYIRAGSPWNQLEGLIRRLDLGRLLRPFTRCMRCNGVLASVDKGAVVGQLPSRVRDAFDLFWRCEGCAQVYWRGSHYQRLQRRVAELRALTPCRASLYKLSL